MPKLLLADDSITIQRVIELTFSGEDVQVVAVSDGDEAIARIVAERPDIVLADIGMPKRSGYDVAAFVKNDPGLAHIPVLLLAGAFEPVDQARAEQVRCDGVLVKPFEPQQVIARVRELVNGAKRTGALPGGSAPGVPRPETGARGELRGGRPEAGFTASAPRVIDSQPIVEIPDPRDAAPAGSDSGDSLDDYFDRLDAAFASLGNGSAPAVPASPALDDLTEPVVPTVDDLLGGVPAEVIPGDPPSLAGRIAGPPVEPPDVSATLAPAAPAIDAPARETETVSAAPEEDSALPESGRNVIADVFSALLAVEQGESAAPPRPAGPRAAAPVTDELVDEVTRRVLERLAPSALNDVVAQVVSEVAERLVREEIARLRGRS